MSQTLRVATYNIKYDDPTRRVSAWANRSDLVLERLAGLNADVIGLQEVLATQLADIAAGLPEFTVIGAGREDGQAAGEHAPLLLRTARVRSTASGTFWLSRNPGVPSTMFGGIPRICTWTRVVDLANDGDGDSDASIGIFNVHLDHRAAWRRALQLQVALRSMRAVKASANIVMGDFNAPLRSLRAPLTVGSLGRLGLTDSRHASKPGSAGSTATFTGWNREIAAGSGPKANDEAQRIDHVLLGSGLRAQSYQVLAERGERLASDHLPVVVDVEVTRPARP